MKRITLALGALALRDRNLGLRWEQRTGHECPGVGGWLQVRSYPASLNGYLSVLGNGVPITVSSLKTYGEVAELLKGGIPRKWMGQGGVSTKLGSEWQLGCGDGIGAEAKASTP